jgi:hypothetical protein
MKYLVFCTFFLYVTTLSAQTELATTFNSTHSGRNIALSISKTYSSKNEFGGGIRYNLGMIAMPDDQNNVYYKRLYPSTFYQQWGLTGFYHRHILNKWENIKPFLFYDLQTSYSTTRKRDFLPYTYDINGDVLYKEHINRFGPFLWIEQCVGFGFKVDLPGNFFITEKIGAGVSFMIGKDERLFSTLDNSLAWEFGGLINVGIGYRFK